MLNHNAESLDLYLETAERVTAFSKEETDQPSTAALITIECLRRLEDEVRSSGTSRQTLQKIESARRILGDPAEFVPFEGRFLLD